MEHLEFALRVAESTAFALHSALAVTDPLHGVITAALGAEGALPRWFLPCGGVLLALVAAGNFSGDAAVVLACQAYVAAWHAGGALYHLRLGHHPAAAAAPGFFVVLAFAVAALRDGPGVATLGLAGSVAAAAVLTPLLVTVRGRPAGNAGKKKL